ncbi:MAG: hypothetical protein IPK87_15330 [Planctomycetes bacterium]|nr:hypothetical protein [Planctomycetota bacterium]
MACPRLASGVVVVVLAGLLQAHPLDDSAELNARVRVVDDTTFELVLEFRYKGVIASYTEFRNGLDRNLDGRVTQPEMKQRFVELADEIALGLNLALDGQPLPLEPDFKRFALQHADDPDGKPATELETATARIFYRFVYTAQAETAPGDHVLEFAFSSPQTVVTSPRDQLFAVGSDGAPLPVTYDFAHQVFPRMRASFTVKAAAVARPQPVQPPAPPPDEPGPEGLGEIPGGLTLGAGAGLALLGFFMLGRRLLRKQGSFGPASLLILAGTAVVLGALVRLGWLKLM